MQSLKNLLTRDNIFLDLRATDKQSLITELVDRLARNGRLQNRKAALKAILERERKVSTGMENGVAIPHGKTNSVQELVTALGIKKKGIDFDSPDGQLSRIFIMTLSPDNRPGPHLQFLGEISQLLDNAEIRHRLADAATVDEALKILGLFDSEV